MRKILPIIVFVFLSPVSLASDYQDEVFKSYRNYFKRLDLTYIQPIGCIKDVKCNLIADFNGDGTKDYAGLYQYTGQKKRHDNLNVDLVVIYSTKKGIEHEIFTHHGRIRANEDNLALYLEEQRAGDMRLFPGTFDPRKFNLKYPGINILKRKPSDSSTYFPTYYWNGERFYAVVKADD